MRSTVEIQQNWRGTSSAYILLYSVLVQNQHTSNSSIRNIHWYSILFLLTKWSQSIVQRNEDYILIEEVSWCVQKPSSGLKGAAMNVNKNVKKGTIPTWKLKNNTLFLKNVIRHTVHFSDDLNFINLRFNGKRSLHF